MRVTKRYVDHPAPGVVMVAILLATRIGWPSAPPCAFIRRIEEFAPELTAEVIL